MTWEVSFRGDVQGPRLELLAPRGARAPVAHRGDRPEAREIGPGAIVNPSRVTARKSPNHFRGLRCTRV